MEENNKNVDELLEQNMSYGEIADLLGINLIDVINYDNQRIRTKRKLQNIPDMPANRKKAIKKMFLEDEMSVSEIANNLGISEKQVNEDLTMMGIHPKLPPVLRKQLLENAKKRKNHSSENKNTSKAEVGGIIATRLKIANLLFEKGVSEDEIYGIFSDLTQDVIDWHIQYVKNHNITGYEEVNNDIQKETATPEKKRSSVFETRPEIIERRKAVYKLIGKKKTSGEIASELGISRATVENDFAFLRKQGLIEDKGTKQEQKEKRQPDSEETKRRRLAIPELRKKFYISEIAEMFGVSTWTINNDIRWLKKEGLIDATEEIRGRRTRKKVQSIESRRKRVASLYGKKDRKEIASILGVGESTIRKRY